MESFKNISEKVKNLELSNTEFSDLSKNIKLQAEDLVLNEFPRRVLKLEDLLKKHFNVKNLYFPVVPNQSLLGDDLDGNVPMKRKINTGKDSLKVSKAIESVITDQNLQCEDVENVSKKRKINTDSGSASGSKAIESVVTDQNLQCEDVENVSKKRKVNTDSGSAPGSKVIESVVPLNHTIDLINLFSPHAHQLLEDIDMLKMWLYFISLQTDNSDYYAKCTLEQILSETQKVEKSTKAFLDEISPFFSSRGDIVSKMSKEPNVEDYRWSVMKKDENFSIQNRQIILELRRYYATLNSMICKNLEKMQEPKTFNPSIMY